MTEACRPDEIRIVGRVVGAVERSCASVPLTREPQVAACAVRDTKVAEEVRGTVAVVILDHGAVEAQRTWRDDAGDPAESTIGLIVPAPGTSLLAPPEGQHRIGAGPAERQV